MRESDFQRVAVGESATIALARKTLRSCILKEIVGNVGTARDSRNLLKEDKSGRKNDKLGGTADTQSFVLKF